MLRVLFSFLGISKGFRGILGKFWRVLGLRTGMELG